MLLSEPSLWKTEVVQLYSGASPCHFTYAERGGIQPSLRELFPHFVVVDIKVRGLEAMPCDVQNLSVILILALHILPAARALPSMSGGRFFFGDFLKLNLAVSFDDFDLKQIRQL